ncbi:MAG: sugar ABC transporter ATP-binding protein [Planctomycetota bacterium]|nr:sugar ABC transporter ATP-binding protein [Planctomycetota bacterium]
MRGVSKAFGSTMALSGVDFDLRPGEVHTLMGENGAGKSTLMKILIGLHHADGGEILLNGNQVKFSSPREALDNGIAMIHQELYPVLDMTVADNIFMGRELLKSRFGPLSLVDFRSTRGRAAGLLREMGLKAAPDALMRQLSVAETQLVEIIKAVSQGARIIIMDEPTSAITEREIEHLFSHIRRLKENGVAIIYISHKMEEIFRISDRITVLRDGTHIATRPASELIPDVLVGMMVGREIRDIYPSRPERPKGEIALEVVGLSDAGKFSGVSFSVRKGEILGMAGLMGAGRTEIAECLFGINPRAGGEIRINGDPTAIRSPRDAIRRGMALISDDRKQKGLNLEATVGENISLLRLRSFSKAGIINRSRERAEIDVYMGKLGVKAESGDAPVTSLSGGNQQKVVLAKWLMAEPEIIVFDEPTRGIDVGAKHDIYVLINELAGRGKAILMISSEMNEIVGMSDRVVVIADGRLTGTLGKDEIDQERIMALASNIA